MKVQLLLLIIKDLNHLKVQLLLLIIKDLQISLQIRQIHVTLKRLLYWKLIDVLCISQLSFFHSLSLQKRMHHFLFWVFFFLKAAKIFFFNCVTRIQRSWARVLRVIPKTLKMVLTAPQPVLVIMSVRKGNA